jgi:hypothetical protein
LVDELISKNAVVQAIVASSAKQPFLLWDKVYQKVTDPADEKWLLRAANAAFKHFHAQIAKSEGLKCVFPFSPMGITLKLNGLYEFL